jgi:hypothetical protein
LSSLIDIKYAQQFDSEKNDPPDTEKLHVISPGRLVCDFKHAVKLKEIRSQYHEGANNGKQ